MRQSRVDGTVNPRIEPHRTDARSHARESWQDVIDSDIDNSRANVDRLVSVVREKTGEGLDAVRENSTNSSLPPGVQFGLRTESLPSERSGASLQGFGPGEKGKVSTWLH